MKKKALTVTQRLDLLEEQLIDNNALCRREIAAVRNAVQALAKHSEPTQPRDYVLTDADWKRVIAEGWLCEFGVEGTKDAPYRICELLGRENDRFIPHYPTKYGPVGPKYWSCKPLNKPGVMQPYFGQGMPVDRDTAVVVMTRDGETFQDLAHAFDFRREGEDSDIIAYMVLPKTGGGI